MSQVIVISGQPGAGSSTITKLIAEKLRLDYFIAGRLFKDIALGEASKQHYYPLFKQLCNKKNLSIPIFHAKNDEEAVRLVWNSPLGKNPAFHSVIDDLQVELAKKASIVIDGKLSVHMIKKASIKIWLTASFKARAERHAYKNNISLEEASRLLEMRQEQERVEWQRIYGFDYWDQELEPNLVVYT